MCLYDRVLYESYDHDMESDNSEKKFGHYARELTLEEMEKLRNEKITINQFKQEKLEKEAAKNWDLFYKRNSSNFFKDRHWTVREFKELSEWNEDVLFRRTLLEIGCGAGNFIFPLIEEKLNLFIHACDVSKRAVDLVKNHQLYDPSLCNAFCCDLTTDDLLSSLEAESIDIVSIIFVLSSIHPEKMEIVLKNVFKIRCIGPGFDPWIIFPSLPVLCLLPLVFLHQDRNHLLLWSPLAFKAYKAYQRDLKLIRNEDED